MDHLVKNKKNIEFPLPKYKKKRFALNGKLNYSANVVIELSRLTIDNFSHHTPKTHPDTFKLVRVILLNIFFSVISISSFMFCNEHK